MQINPLRSRALVHSPFIAQRTHIPLDARDEAGGPAYDDRGFPERGLERAADYTAGLRTACVQGYGGVDGR